MAKHKSHIKYEVSHIAYPFRLVRQFILLSVLLLSPLTRVPAQIINIEDRRQPSDTAGWYGQLDLGGAYTENQTTILTLNGGLRVDRVREGSASIAATNYRLVRVGGNNAINAAYLHFRHTVDLSERWQWVSFTQAQFDEQLRLDLRALLGSGMTRKLYDKGKDRIYLSALYMYEYDELRASSIIYRDHRLSTYLTVSIELLKRVRLSNTTYYQPRLIDFTRPRVSSTTALTLGFSKHLALNLSYAITHDERPADDLRDVPATTTNYLTNLRWSF